MRKYIIILFAVVLSCSSEDNTSLNLEDTKQMLLSNTWYFQKSEDLNTQDIYTANECENNRFLQFSSNNTFVEQYYYRESIDNCVDDGQISGTYQITSSSEFTLIADAENYQYKILSINSEELVIEYLEDNEAYTYTSN